MSFVCHGLEAGIHRTANRCLFKVKSRRVHDTRFRSARAGNSKSPCLTGLHKCASFQQTETRSHMRICNCVGALEPFVVRINQVADLLWVDHRGWTGSVECSQSAYRMRTTQAYANSNAIIVSSFISRSRVPPCCNRLPLNCKSRDTTT